MSSPFSPVDRVESHLPTASSTNSLLKFFRRTSSTESDQTRYQSDEDEDEDEGLDQDERDERDGDQDGDRNGDGGGDGLAEEEDGEIDSRRHYHDASGISHSERMIDSDEEMDHDPPSSQPSISAIVEESNGSATRPSRLLPSALPAVPSEVQVTRAQSLPLTPSQHPRPRINTNPNSNQGSILSPSSSSSLPFTHPGFGNSISWTPGLPTPPPYIPIVPLTQRETSSNSSASIIQLDLETDLMSPMRHMNTHQLQADVSIVDVIPPYSPSSTLSSGFSFNSSSSNSSQSDDPLPPPPSRHPSLIRQKGVYLDHTSRSLSMPIDMRQRHRYHQQLQRQVQQREADYQASRRAVGDPTPFLPSNDGTLLTSPVDADSDDLPPM